MNFEPPQQPSATASESESTNRARLATRICWSASAALIVVFVVNFLFEQYVAEGVPFQRSFQKLWLSSLLFALPLVFHSGLCILFGRSNSLSFMALPSALLAAGIAVLQMLSMLIQFFAYLVVGDGSGVAWVEGLTLLFSLFLGWVYAPLYWLSILTLLVIVGIVLFAESRQSTQSHAEG